ncbi:HAD family hydrolase [Desulfopila sp. IMCC35008]|uniref:HAD family hydrolase n=1 Tax=Desulfopila sp. IMCC35008 TaxID=2653858 RepID=UPI0013D780FE|nr:HAD-IA family hydrolase [Desulfopila sp. IMCC35008]
MTLPRELKTIIFDCDGVMFQSIKANQAYYNHLLKHFGRGPMNDEELEYVHIHNVMDSIQYIFRNYPDRPEEIHAYRSQVSYHPFLKYMQIEPDLIPFLEATKSRFNLAIATNRTDTMEALLDEFSLTGYFGKVQTASNSRKPKPAADPLLEILEHFDNTVDEAIFIGDSTVDEETAKNCGMRLVAFKNKALDSACYIENFTELLNLLPIK